MSTTLETAESDGPKLDVVEADYRVAVFALPDDRDALLRELRRHLRLNALDARILAHELPGILPKPMPRSEAEHVADAIRCLGVNAQAVPVTHCLDLSRAPTVHHLQLGDEGLEVLDVAGKRSARIPWDHVTLISIADVPLDGIRHYIPARTTVIRMTPRIKEGQIETQTVHGAELWIVCAPPLQAFRVDHREFNYESLGAAITGSAAANFQVLAQDLVRRARRACLTPVTRAFLKRKPSHSYRLNSLDEHRRLVELHYALMQCERSESERASLAAPAGAATERTPTMTTTSLPAETTALMKAHEALNREIADLKEWCHEIEELGQPRFGQLGIRLDALRARLAAHFAFEEEGGYMAPVLKAAPQKSPQAAELLTEHGRMLHQIDDLSARLRACPCEYGCWSEALRDISSLLDGLARHEHAENELWQTAFDDAPGVGD